MPNAPLTLSLIAGLEADAPDFALDAKTRQKLVTDLRDKARSFKELAPFDLGERLVRFLGEQLRKPLADVLEELWSQRKELRDMERDGEKQHDVEKEVHLFDHSMSWELHPSVELRVNATRVGTMTFDLTAELTLNGLQLVIKNATITGIKAGELKSSVTLSYEGLPLMAPIEGKVDLPVKFDLPKGGIRLGGPPKKSVS